MIKVERGETYLKQLDNLKELLGFIVDISYDYHCEDREACQAQVGLGAIRVLCKGKQTEEEFKKVWEKWRENNGIPEVEKCEHMECGTCALGKVIREEESQQTSAGPGFAKGWDEDNLGSKIRR